MNKTETRGIQTIPAFCSCGWGVQDFKTVVRASLPMNCPDCDAVIDEDREEEEEKKGKCSV